eukprot:TRINITY_DN4710_c0_g1_i1.p1 TRINITY_DN4710_c0_g1~~TRINITY_DN4710_c0_g1_i1.p1  ORF type:complete len:221 (-),score=49.74 TRINITY_DN4710_c0_g1_i1:135-761(-)
MLKLFLIFSLFFAFTVAQDFPFFSFPFSRYAFNGSISFIEEGRPVIVGNATFYYDSLSTPGMNKTRVNVVDAQNAKTSAWYFLDKTSFSFWALTPEGKCVGGKNSQQPCSGYRSENKGREVVNGKLSTHVSNSCTFPFGGIDVYISEDYWINAQNPNDLVAAQTNFGGISVTKVVVASNTANVDSNVFVVPSSCAPSPKVSHAIILKD